MPSDRSGDPVQIYDTTLRDGCQRAGLSLSCDDKLRIAGRLDNLGVSYIEGGWPGSNPKDVEFFERIGELGLRHARVAAFGSTRRVGTRAEDDANLAALLRAGTPVCTIVGKTWSLHVRDVIRTTLDENLELIRDSVAFLKAAGKEVVYDAENFFDGYAADSGYALATLEAAADAGADVAVLCETNGGAMPWVVEDVVRAVQSRLAGRKIALGFHGHNDSDCAVANSVTAVRAGIRHVQGTINGYGERCGNANLISIIANLELKLGLRCIPEGGLRQLTELSHYVAEMANLAPDDYAAFVGHNAFAHKGGIHVAAIRRNPDSYQHIDPSLVGNRMRVVVSELSGRGNVLSKADELGIDVGTGESANEVLQEIKANEARGFSYEAAEASIALMLKRRSPEYRAPFELIDYMVTVEHRDGRGTFAEATVKVRIGETIEHTAAEGDGPVSALDRALRKALRNTYPELSRIKLVDYKVRILDTDRATSATTRVLVTSTDGEQHWSTVGASTNIIEASWRALTDALEYGLTPVRG